MVFKLRRTKSISEIDYSNRFPKINVVLDEKLLVTYLKSDFSAYETLIFGDCGNALGPVSSSLVTKNEIGGMESAIRTHISIYCLLTESNKIPDWLTK